MYCNYTNICIIYNHKEIQTNMIYFYSGWRRSKMAALCSVEGEQRSARFGGSTTTTLKPWRPFTPRSRLTSRERTKVLLGLGTVPRYSLDTN